MALRRLFSGWLIAMAALARSVAQALERASEDRSVSPPDSVMAALAERYPGAPAHWLAHVAERTAQLAESGEAPLSLNSDPAIWPSPWPEASPSPVEAMERVAVPRDPPSARPAPRHEATVPTLAALRERQSDVWRRPEVTSKRRPRPVFASSASASEPAIHAPSAPSASALARRPRSPLSVKSDAPFSARPRVTSTSKAGGSLESTQPEAAWPDGPRLRAETPGEAERRSIRWPSTEGAPPNRALAETGAARQPELQPDGTEATAVSRGRKSWLVEALIERPARVFRSFAPRIGPARRTGPAGEAWAATDRAGAVELAPAAPAAGVTGDVRRPRSSRSTDAPIQPAPAARDAIFQALAGLGARSEHRPAAGPTIAGRAPSSGRTSGDAPPRVLASSPAPRKRTFSTPAPSIVSRSGPDWDLTPPATRSSEPLPWEQECEASTLERIAYASDDQAHDRAKRPIFTAPGAVPSRTAARRFADSPPEDRWPLPPPANLEPPQGVAAPSPRWEDLAREQEEGRWSV